MTGAAWRAGAEELRRLAPRDILFPCVANSARSQMADGIARALAPAGVPAQGVDAVVTLCAEEVGSPRVA